MEAEKVNGSTPPSNMFRDECDGVSITDFLAATSVFKGEIITGTIVCFGTGGELPEELFENMWEDSPL